MVKNYIDIVPSPTMRREVRLPASKSICNRALIIHALSRSEAELENLSDCDDTQTMLAALRDMPEVIDIGAAGTAMRFLTAYLCLTPGTRTITGSERMRHRPIGVLVDALRKLGAQVEYEGEEGFPPLRITGSASLEGGVLSVPGNVSSQYISALLMIAPMLRNGLRLTLTENVVSRPYLDMTLTVMRDFGAQAEWEAGNVVRVAPGGYRPKPYRIENDWSAASYWYEMVALTRDVDCWVELPGLRIDSIQGDSCVRRIFEDLGVATEPCICTSGEAGVRLNKGGRVVPRLDYDFTDCPDLAQTVTVTCALMAVPFRFTGLHSLRIKETDRIAALCNELGAMGYVLDDSEEGTLKWDGARREAEREIPVISTYDDHRMAMAFAPVCFRCGRVRILNPEVVSKSYPSFWEEMGREKD